MCTDYSGKSRRFKSLKSGVAAEILILEPRILPAVNLNLTDVSLVNGQGRQIESPVIGETVRVHAKWDASGITIGNSYTVRFSVNGVPLDVGFQSQTSSEASIQWTRWNWIAESGLNTVHVQLDSGGVISEANELDNTRTLTFQANPPADLPQKFAWPVEGVRGRDWSITAYVDKDPRQNRWVDYEGGAVTYDGHDAIDIGIGNFASMDEGVAVLAAAGGTIEAAVDGNTDRNLLTLNAKNPPPSNWLRINHGNGWTTEYFHLARNSFKVKVGDRVVRGQQIADIGSSGHSNGPHLHFVVKRNESIVDPQTLPSSYFVRPLSYQGARSAEALDSGITNDWFRDNAGNWPDIHERPSEARTFSGREQKDIHFWSLLSQTRVGDVFECSWHLPDGTRFSMERSVAEARGVMVPYLFILPVSQTAGKLGLWNVTLRANGRIVAQQSFRITSMATPPEIRVRLGNALVLPGRRTPINFGRTKEGSAEVTRTFTIDNHGGSELQLRNLSIPTGFRLVSAFPSKIGPGKALRLTVAMSTVSRGLKTGVLNFRTNDTDESLISIQLEGLVI
jgi:murein DD-endopeptidase MepM/ murein hydrolase activator NlpD